MMMKDKQNCYIKFGESEAKTNESSTNADYK